MSSALITGKRPDGEVGNFDVGVALVLSTLRGILGTYGFIWISGPWFRPGTEGREETVFSDGVVAAIWLFCKPPR